jgi:cell division transport system permease protein
MSLASVIIVIATLFIFGCFLLIALNLEHNLNSLKSQPQLQVFCYTVLDDTQVAQVEEAIKADEGIASYTVVTKQQAFEKVKEFLGNDNGVLEGLDESFLPVSFIIELKDPEQSRTVIENLRQISGVETIKYSQDTIDMISKVTYWINLISSIMIVILAVVSVFIISNTIKLTVFARRKEITIMKYIGATDWFIRWPFVVEGVIIGIVGAVLAFVLSAYGYNAVEAKFNSDLLSISRDFFKFLKIGDIWRQLASLYLIIGVAVGATGSFISIRRYLRV